jgi:hypothetical protein
VSVGVGAGVSVGVGAGVSVGAGVGVSVGTGGVSVGIGVGVHSTRLVGRFPGLSVSNGWGHPIGSAEDDPAVARTTPAARTHAPPDLTAWLHCGQHNEYGYGRFFDFQR